jgi:hypothetical protein
VPTLEPVKVCGCEEPTKPVLGDEPVKVAEPAEPTKAEPKEVEPTKAPVGCEPIKVVAAPALSGARKRTTLSSEAMTDVFLFVLFHNFCWLFLLVLVRRLLGLIRKLKFFSMF